MIDSSRKLLLPALGVLALVAGGCSVSASGEIPCVEDVSCPHDYPVCSNGKCIEGTSTASASIAIVGADGHSPSDFLSGTVRVTVSARATSGVASVKLASGTTDFPAATPAAAPPQTGAPQSTSKVAPLSASRVRCDGPAATDDRDRAIRARERVGSHRGLDDPPRRGNALAPR